MYEVKKEGHGTLARENRALFQGGIIRQLPGTAVRMGPGEAPEPPEPAPLLNPSPPELPSPPHPAISRIEISKNTTAIIAHHVSDLEFLLDSIVFSPFTHLR